MDKKLYKPTSPPPASAARAQHPLHHVLHRHVLMHPSDVPVDELDATKLVLRDHQGGEYVVTACRKEHVQAAVRDGRQRAGQTGRVPAAARRVQRAGRQEALVGGAGNERRNKGGGDGWVCSCKEGAVPLVKKRRRARHRSISRRELPARDSHGGGAESEVKDEAGRTSPSTQRRRRRGGHSMDDEQHSKEEEADVTGRTKRGRLTSAGTCCRMPTYHSDSTRSQLADSVAPSSATSPPIRSRASWT